MSKRTSLRNHYDTRLKNRWRKAPFVLRFTDWADVSGTVVVVKERVALDRGDFEAKSNNRSVLKERGHVHGESLKRLAPLLRKLVETVCDDGGVPLELQRFFSQEGLKFRDNLPFDEEAGAKIALILRLQERLASPDRVELMARRIQCFSREEAAYWLSRTTSYGEDANRWALSGLRVMLAGQGSQDPGIERMLLRLR